MVRTLCRPTSDCKPFSNKVLSTHSVLELYSVGEHGAHKHISKLKLMIAGFELL